MAVNNDLSERELEILKLVATGASNKEIARDLFISTNTVKVHLRNIFAKIGVVSRTEAAMYAVQMGVVAGNNTVEGSYAAPGEAKGVAGNWRFALPLGVIIIALLGIILFRQAQQAQQSPGDDLGQSEQARWQEKAPMPTARFGLAATVYENQIYAIGGETAQSVTGAVEKYDPQTDTWETLSPKPVPVSDVSAALLGGLIYVPGGRLSSGMVTDKLEIYDPLEDTWREGAPLPVPLSAYALAAYEGRLYLFGGWDGDNYVDTVFTYETAQDKWQEVVSMHMARGYASATVAGGKIYVLGGFDGEVALDTNDVFFPDRYDNPEEAWLEATPMPDGRYGFRSISVADIIYVVGGKNNSTDQISSFRYQPISDSWQEFVNPVTKPWFYLGVVALETKLYILGGQLEEEPTNQNLAYQAMYTITIPLVR